MAKQQGPLERAQALISTVPVPDDAEAQLAEILKELPEYLHEDLWEGLDVTQMANGDFDEVSIEGDNLLTS